MKKEPIKLQDLPRGLRFSLDYLGRKTPYSAEVWGVLGKAEDGILCFQILTASSLYTERVFKPSTPVYPISPETSVKCFLRGDK